MPQRTLSTLYRVAQQALEYVMRHAKATRVEATVSVNDGQVRLRVSDNGVGIGDQDRRKPGCFGLLVASERLAQIAGTLRTMGVVNRGTTLEASAPLGRERARLDIASSPGG